MRRDLCSTRSALLVAFLALIEPASDAWAAGLHARHRWSGERHGQVDRGERLQRLAKGLGLTQEQKTEIRDILSAHRSELRPRIEAVLAARRERLAAIRSEAFDEAGIRSAGERLSAAETELAVARGRMVAQLRSVLTPEQRVEAQRLLKGARSVARERVRSLERRLQRRTW